MGGHHSGGICRGTQRHLSVTGFDWLIEAQPIRDAQSRQLPWYGNLLKSFYCTNSSSFSYVIALSVRFDSVRQFGSFNIATKEKIVSFTCRMDSISLQPTVKVVSNLYDNNIISNKTLLQRSIIVADVDATAARSPLSRKSIIIIAWANRPNIGCILRSSSTDRPTDRP